MSFFIVTITHPDGDAWNKHLVAHVHYLQKLVEDGILRASGLTVKIWISDHVSRVRREVEATVSRGPFALEGLIESLTIFGGILCLELLPQNLAER
jgi:uncharacterized protein YciI